MVTEELGSAEVVVNLISEGVNCALDDGKSGIVVLDILCVGLSVTGVGISLLLRLCPRVVHGDVGGLICGDNDIDVVECDVNVLDLDTDGLNCNKDIGGDVYSSDKVIIGDELLVEVETLSLGLDIIVVDHSVSVGPDGSVLGGCVSDSSEEGGNIDLHAFRYFGNLFKFKLITAN